MPVTLQLTVDLYLGRWANPVKKRELWAVVQAHVVKDSLTAFARALGAQGQSDPNFKYRMVDRGSQDELVPVALPSDLDLEIRLVDAAGTVLRRLFNPRSNGNYVEQPDTLYADNREALSPEAIPERPGPFAALYVSRLRDAVIDAGTDFDHVCDLLRVALWRGTRVNIGAGVLRMLDPDCARMLLDPLPASGLTGEVTNLHSLLGQVLLLHSDAHDGAPPLTAEWLEIALTRNGQPVATVPPANVPEARIAYRTFFSSLATPLTRPEDALKWDEIPMDRAVAVIDVSTNFDAVPPKPSAGEPWRFRRRNERTGAPDTTDLDASSLRRACVRWGDNPAAALANFPADAPTLRFSLWNSFDARLRPYRGAPITEGERGKREDRSILLEAVVSVNDRSLLARLHEDPTRPLQSALVLDASGASLKVLAVGSFVLPWDQPEDRDDSAPTLLFVIEKAETGDLSKCTGGPVTVLAPCLAATGAPLELLCTARDVADPTAPLGPRWECSNLDEIRASKASFDVLALAQIPPAVAGQVRPALQFDNDLDFRPARGATAIEFQLTTRVQHAALSSDPASIDATFEFAQDLINFSAANLITHWADRTRLLNPHSDLYPVIARYRQSSDEIAQTYYWRGHEDLPGLDAGGSPADIANYYRCIGSNRELKIALEHTTGDLLSPESPIPLSLGTPFDFPPIHPADVATQPDKGGALSLLRVGFEAAAGTSPQALVLELDAALFGAPDDIAAQAWRSLAELVHAEDIVLGVNAVRFRFRRGKGSKLIANALESVDLGDDMKDWKVTAEVSAWASALLSGAAPSNLRLPLPNGVPPLGLVCHAFRVEMRIARADDQCFAPDLASYDLYRLLWPDMRPEDVDPKTREALPHQSANTTDTRNAFGGWLHARREATRSIAAGKTEQTYARDYARILGQEDGSWIVPSQNITPDGTACSVFALPLGIRPLANIDPFGASTPTSIDNLMRVLQGLVDGRFVGMGWWACSNWRDWFARLSSAALPLKSLCEAFGRLLFPLPDPLQSDIDPRAAAAIVELRQSAALKTMADRLSQMALRDFDLVSNAKGVLLARLADDPQRLSDDFCRITLRKCPDLDVAGKNPARPAVANVSEDVPSVVADEDRYWYHAGIANLASTNDSWFGFLDVLDNVRYGNHFGIENLMLESFEGVIEKPGQPSLDVLGSEIVTPGGPQSIGARAIPMHLPARTPAAAPSHVFSAVLPSQQPRGALVTWSGYGLSAPAFRQGRLVRPGLGEESLTFWLTQTQSTRSARLDRVIVTTAWAIAGAEESGLLAFTEDNYLLRTGLPSARPITPQAARAGIGRLADAAKWQDVSAVPRDTVVLEWLDPESVSMLASLVRAAPPPASPAEPETLSVQVAPQGTGFALAVYDWNGTQIGSVARTAEAALLRSNAASPEAASAFLLVNLELPVWHASRVRARLVRNDASSNAPGDRFAPDFWTSAEEAPDERVVSLTKTVSLADQVAAVAKRVDLSPMALIQLLFVVPSFIDMPDAEHDWTEHTTTIVVEAVQRLAWPSSKGGPTFDTNEECARKPLRLVTLPPRSSGGLDAWNEMIRWFDADYDEFVVSVHWSNEANTTFFTLDDRYVNVVDGVREA